MDSLYGFIVLGAGIGTVLSLFIFNSYKQKNKIRLKISIIITILSIVYILLFGILVSDYAYMILIGQVGTHIVFYFLLRESKRDKQKIVPYINEYDKYNDNITDKGNSVDAVNTKSLDKVKIIKNKETTVATEVMKSDVTTEEDNLPVTNH